ncbi:hypothetical protein [Rhizobium laguerreae]|uniref:hypothetical protein n=1 Tax=Rhizobium laguerreae TaxID=1076926 RepID=UPI001C8FF203|nr:hypothetical protein [Rhizobium laguerreae]MBY3348027.1 hypothetical protein [Rhizobium laguerreae]MBY3354990.1 hypothetical protein [Rhizobium laguerreae]MBY3376295.1 hypothetical protein [Rhizobium laguerreae]MBY3454001.1 hypothetical protein [Rhizobium laguerreae]MBY3461149.1 hypothetical protein [Rhizobium laguerreae]
MVHLIPDESDPILRSMRMTSNVKAVPLDLFVVSKMISVGWKTRSVGLGFISLQGVGFEDGRASWMSATSHVKTGLRDPSARNGREGAT